MTDVKKFENGCTITRGLTGYGYRSFLVSASISHLPDEDADQTNTFGYYKNVIERQHGSSGHMSEASDCHYGFSAALYSTRQLPF